MNQNFLKDIIQWDVHNWSKALPFWERFLTIHNPKKTKVLTIGEREGGISLWLASKGYSNYCTDRNNPEAIAKPLHEKYGVLNLVEYKSADIFNLPFPDNHFDTVILKSVIGGLKLNYKDKSTRNIENQKKAITEIRRVLKPGGVLLGAENMKGSAFHFLLRKFTGKLDGWRYLSMEDLDYLFEDFSERNYKFYGFFGSLYPWKVFNIISGISDKFLSIIFPKRWRYIGIYAVVK